MMPLNSSTPMASADRSALDLNHSAPRHVPSHVAQGPAAAANQAGMNDRPAAGPEASSEVARHPAGRETQAGGRPMQIPKIKLGLPLRKRPQEVRRIAIEVFPAADSWVVFYREILGVDGVARKLFKSVQEVRQWEASEEFLEIQEMITALRSSDSGKGDSAEPQRMITIRLPTSLHEALKVEAKEHQTSMNKLCTSKLLMCIAERFVPVESGRIRGRKPGPQGKRKAAAEQVSDDAH